MRLVFAGTPEVALPSLRALLDSTHDVLAVITRPDARVGRGRSVSRSPVAQLADEHGIEVLTPQRANDADFLDRLTALAPDCCPVVAYGALLGQQALDIPPQGWVNLHFSLLPAWRGAAPVQASIRAGDDITGASTFRIVRALDAGPVYGVITEKVRADDTAAALLDRLSVSGAELLTATVDAIAEGTASAREQQSDGVSYAGKIDVADAEVDFSRPAIEVDRLIRSVTPDPGAWTWLAGERIKLGPVAITGFESIPPGEIVLTRKQVLVGTSTVPVVLSDVQSPGKKRMAATDWARGARLGAGVRFGAEGVRS